MFEPKLTDSHPQSVKTYPQKCSASNGTVKQKSSWPTGRSAKRVGATGELSTALCCREERIIAGWIVCRKCGLRRN